jgi:YHS domain-containing protein
MEKDPVCGMDVNPANAPAQSNYRGRTFYFCSQDCKEQFEREPQRYVGQEQLKQGQEQARQTGGAPRRT